eukprot:RCo002868
MLWLSLLFLTLLGGILAVEVLKTFPHHQGCFTQGLVFEPATQRMYESCGGFAESSVRYGSLDVMQKEVRQPGIFTEGLAMLPNSSALLQLTWRNGFANLLHPETLNTTGRWEYAGEGWGLAMGSNGVLYMSNGSQWVTRLDPVTRAPVLPPLRVRDQAGQDVHNVNELEWVRGELWANIWMTHSVARISPSTGVLLGRVDFSPLWEHLSGVRLQYDDVLNGIAYDPASDRLWVTGKRWPLLFQVVVDGIGSGVVTPPSPSQSRPPPALAAPQIALIVITLSVAAALGVGTVALVWRKRRSRMLGRRMPELEMEPEGEEMNSPVPPLR